MYFKLYLYCAYPIQYFIKSGIVIRYHYSDYNIKYKCVSNILIINNNKSN